MSTSGDRPNSYPRSSGQISMTAYLQQVKADVVLAFFGYNESFENKPDEYRKLLVDFVKKTRASKANGKTFPRIVLFSPLAHEDTRNPNVPDGKAHNAQLEAYTKATGGTERSFLSYKDLERVVMDIGEELHSQYMISYSPSNPDEGGYHEITVEVNRGNLKVRTRPGYWMAAVPEHMR